MSAMVCRYLDGIPETDEDRVIDGIPTLRYFVPAAVLLHKENGSIVFAVKDDGGSQFLTQKSKTLSAALV